MLAVKEAVRERQVPGVLIKVDQHALCSHCSRCLRFHRASHCIFCVCAAPLLANHLCRACPIRQPPLAAPPLPRPTAAPYQAHPRTALPRGRPLLQEVHQVTACKLVLRYSGIGLRHTLLLSLLCMTYKTHCLLTTKPNRNWYLSRSLVADRTSQISLGPYNSGIMSLQVELQALQGPLHLALALPKPAVAALLPNQR